MLPIHTDVTIYAYVWCWARTFGSLDKIPSVSCKSKILHQKTDPKVQQDFKGQGHYEKY